MTLQTNPAILPAETTLGLVALTVGDLARSTAFYGDSLGFTLLHEAPGQAVLGTPSTPLLLLRETPGAPPASPRATGLYHFAILVPDRAALGRTLLRLAQSGYPLEGASDHLVSEALYLSDPDGNGIEIYRDRPRAEWPYNNGRLQMASDPVDLRALLIEAQTGGVPDTRLPDGTRLGHMHLQVADLAQARAFYEGVLGFEMVVDWSSRGALFVSAGGYHHHLGLNTWRSRNGRPAAPGSAGLRFFTIHLPTAESLAPVQARLDAAGVAHQPEDGGLTFADPWGNGIRVLVGSAVPAEAAVPTTA